MVAFFLPDIHDRPTGGNIYNRQVIDALSELMPVDMQIEGTDTFRIPVGDDVKAEGRVGVVDSLLLQEQYDFNEWHERFRLDHLLLLVHYLHLADPTRHDTPEAAREREVLEAFDGFVTTSQYVRNQLLTQDIEPRSVAVVRPGLAAAYRSPASTVASPSPVLLTVASLLPGKGLFTCLTILKSLSDQSWRWQIIGDDTLDSAYARRFRRRVAASAINDRIELLGPVSSEEIISRYDAADILLLPSRFETCSMVTMEAMARGLPVVVFDVGGLPELIRQGKTGYRVPPGDTAAYTSRLRTLLAQPEKRRKLGARSAEVSEQFDSWQQAGRRFYRLLLHMEAGSLIP